MIGKLVTRIINLDYTEVARPLSIEDVMRDIEQCVEGCCEYPNEIVMWEHQWNWLTKDVDNTGSYLWGKPDGRVGYKMLVGIHVRIAND